LESLCWSYFSIEEVSLPSIRKPCIREEEMKRGKFIFYNHVLFQVSFL